MRAVFALLFLLVVGYCSAEIVRNTGKCADESRLLCSLRKADCDTDQSIARSCPATCNSCKALEQRVYNFTYFGVRARGEQIRWILEQGDAHWIDTRVDFTKDWPTLKPKTLTGQLPFLEVDGVTIAQSGAIAMFVAVELGLAGKTNLETAQVHMIWDTVQEAYNAGGALLFINDKTEQAAKMKEFNEIQLPRVIKFLENRLKNGDKWLVGNKLTMADIITASLFHALTGPSQDVVSASQAISKLTTDVINLPKIKEWIAKRPAE